MHTHMDLSFFGSPKRRVPVLGGPKSLILGQIGPSVNRFFFEFHVGCGTNCTATEKKTCVILSVYRR